jgi:hypothetical protein
MPADSDTNATGSNLAPEIDRKQRRKAAKLELPARAAGRVSR